ncbi:MAG: DUF6151 family protein [Polyangiaceae bacterium]
MSVDAALQCRCGEVRGRVANASPASANRAVCYCADCQAFLHALERTDLFSDAQGGSDIVQIAPNALTFERGQDRIGCMRLSPKGLFRFHTTCCRTPLGNVVGTSVPFIGILVPAFAVDGRTATDAFGPSRGSIWGKAAIGTPPPGSDGLNLGLMLHAMRLVLGWKLTGKTWPHPFFERGANAPRYPVRVLSAAERDELRALTGPRPAP